MEASDLNLYHYIEQHISKSPEVQLLSLDDDNGHGSENHILNLISCKSPEINDQIKLNIINEYCRYGPLEQILNDESISEIMINSFDNIWYESNGVSKKLQDHFYSKKSYEYFLQRLFSEIGNHIDLATPTLNGKWRNFRVHAIGQPITHYSTVLTLRKHPNSPWDLNRLIKFKWCSHEEGEKIKELINSKKNIIFIGPTGSGKTSLLNSCLSITLKNERSIILEDTPEINIPNEISLKLLTREDSKSILPDVKLCDLIKEALRMKPDRLILGELRGAEAKDFILATSTGHSGTMATLHANNAHEALMRLEVLIQLGAPQWSGETVKKLIRHGVDYILISNTDESGMRKFKGAFKICALDTCGFILDHEF